MRMTLIVLTFVACASVFSAPVEAGILSRLFGGKGCSDSSSTCASACDSGASVCSFAVCRFAVCTGYGVYARPSVLQSGNAVDHNHLCSRNSSVCTCSVCSCPDGAFLCNSSTGNSNPKSSKGLCTKCSQMRPTSGCRCFLLHTFRRQLRSQMRSSQSPRGPKSLLIV